MSDTETPPRVSEDVEAVTLEAELLREDAEREIAKAITGHRGVAREHVKWVRRRNPDASPTEIIGILERQYVTAITVAGGVVTAGTIGIGFLPGGGAATGSLKAAVIGAAKVAAGSKVLPAADEQLQFEITALFGLALADIHGMDLDREQEKALVYGLSNGQVSQAQVATFATELATTAASSSAVAIGQSVSAGHSDWSHWASTLANSLPGTGAEALVRSVQAGKLEDIRQGLGAKQQTAVEIGVGTVMGGATRFVFGRAVVGASREAFPKAPTAFPDYLDVLAKEEPDKDQDVSNRALEALENAGRVVGSGVTTSATTIGSGVASAANMVARSFRSVDPDGDGVPDGPPALTAARGVRGAIAGAASVVGGRAAGLFKRKKSGGDAAGGSQRELECGGVDT